jgi:chromosome segregation ATPase
MDTNFREAVALYDYLVEYHKEGYLVQEMHQTMEPFTPEALEDFAEILASLSYLTYRYGGNLMEEMEQDYLAEERILKELHDREAIAQLAQMKKNMAASGKSMEQYLLALEQRNVVLEKDRVEQRTLEARLQERDRKIHDQQNTCRKLELSVADLEHEVAQQTAAMERLNAQREQELQQAREAHNRAMEKKQEQMDALEDQLTFVRAQLHGLRKKNGLISEEDDYSSREMFAELEKEYAAFRRFFEGQWKQTKKNIRKNTIWKKKTPAEGDISEDIAEKMTVTADASNPEKDGE